MLLMKRNADFVVSLLAVLKAGCAYSALSAELPEEALQHILQDAAPALVIMHGGLHALLPKGAGAPPVFNFDSAPDSELLSKRSALCWTCQQSTAHVCHLWAKLRCLPASLVMHVRSSMNILRACI